MVEDSESKKKNVGWEKGVGVTGWPEVNRFSLGTPLARPKDQISGWKT